MVVLTICVITYKASQTVRRRLTNLLRWGTVIVVLTTFVAYLAPRVSPVSFWPITFLGLAYPWLLLLNGILLLLWLSLREKYFFIPLGCILLGYGHLTNFMGVNFRSTKVGKQKEPIEVMSYNMHYLEGITTLKGTKREQKQNEFIKLFKNIRPSILCIQEANEVNLDFIGAHLEYQNIHYIKHRNGSAILTDYPMLDKGKIDFGNNYDYCLWADLDIAGKRVRVYSIYLASNRISTMANKVAKEADLQDKETWRTVKGMISNVKTASQRRARQAKVISSDIANCKYPVLLCGDLNDTPLSFTYRQISTNMQDAFQEKGLGIGTTYGGTIPALRIDYILVDQRFNIHDFEKYKVDFSDHFPIHSTLSLKNQNYQRVMEQK